MIFINDAWRARPCPRAPQAAAARGFLSYAYTRPMRPGGAMATVARKMAEALNASHHGCDEADVIHTLLVKRADELRAAPRARRRRQISS
jgi:hypothetical protein